MFVNMDFGLPCRGDTITWRKIAWRKITDIWVKNESFFMQLKLHFSKSLLIQAYEEMCNFARIFCENKLMPHCFLQHALR